MHSAILRGSDFKIKYQNIDITHNKYCKSVTSSTRLGVYAPNGTDALGATNLILLYVTAFYDLLRQDGEEFHAYPEFFTFQCQEKLIDYGMLDIYPAEKNVLIKNSESALLKALKEKKINFLLVPENSEFIDTVSKSVDVCYLYSQSGEIENSNLSIKSERPEISDWVTELIVKNNLPETLLSCLGSKRSQSFYRLK